MHKGTGVLEMHVGKDGFGMNVGMGGTDISLGTIANAIQGAQHWRTNVRIEERAKELGLDVASVLRSQYGFGDGFARAQLDSILDGSTDLVKRDGKDGEAQTVRENDKRVVYLDNYKEDMTREEMLRMGVTLQHEAYRDGVVDENNVAETVFAVYGHTAMTERIEQDSRYSDMMKNLVAKDANLRNDREQLATAGDDLAKYAEYVLGTYDSSGDFWKLMEDGSLAYDGDGWLKDPNGNYILDENGKRIGDEKVQKGLENILNISDEDAVKILKDQKIELNDGTYWTHDGNKDKKITLKNEAYFQKYRENLIEHNTLNIYTRLVNEGKMDRDSRYEATLKGAGKEIADKLYGSAYISYEQYKNNNYIQGRGDIQTTGPVDNEKEVSTVFAATGDRSKNPHRGIDLATEMGTEINAMLWNDRTTVKFANYGADFANTAQGNMVGLETIVSYMYKGQMREDVVLHRYMHLNNEQVVTTRTPLIGSIASIIGKSGNSGQWDGSGYKAHLHGDISVGVNRSPLFDYMANNYSSAQMTDILYDNRIYYDPMMFFPKEGYPVRQDAGEYNK